MISFPRLVSIEIRRRVDTSGAVFGWAALLALIVGCGVLSITAVARVASFGLGEVIVTTGLAAVLASSIIGVLAGVGDPGAACERDAVSVGISRSTAHLSRAVACLVLVFSLVVVTITIAGLCAGVAVICGGHSTSERALASSGELLTLALSSGAFGFGIGSAVRSQALGLVSAVLIVLVVDTALNFVGSWGSFVRFSSVQASLTGTAPLLPGVSSGAIWIGLPLLIGWYRSLKASR